jgi:hypothetical protein
LLFWKESYKYYGKLRQTFFSEKSGVATAVAFFTGPVLNQVSNKESPNDTINVAVIGIRSRARDLCRARLKIPRLNIAVLCDIDQRLLPDAAKEVEDLSGIKLATLAEYRKVLENKDIDDVVIATPNHWHGLQTIWACQASKRMYTWKTPFPKPCGRAGKWWRRPENMAGWSRPARRPGAASMRFRPSIY